MPRAKWMSDAQFRSYERCLKHLEGKKGINRFAACTASIKKRRKKTKKWVHKALNK